MVSKSTDYHKDRYPKHDSDKGQVYGGECNTTRCDNSSSVHFNTQTRGMYCPTCAMGINKWSMIDNGVDICLHVQEKPSIEEMDKLYSDMCSIIRAN